VTSRPFYRREKRTVFEESNSPFPPRAGCSAGFGIAAPTITTPMSAFVPLIRLRDNPRRRRRLLCFFLSPHSTWNISTHPGISRVLQSVSLREKSCLRYPKSDDSVRFSCDPENAYFNARDCQIIERTLQKMLRDSNVRFQIFIRYNINVLFENITEYEI